MTIAFNCSNCSQQYRVAVENAGKTARCKKCGEKCRVPTVKRDEQPVVPEPVQTAPSASGTKPPQRGLSRVQVIAPVVVGVLVLCFAIYGAVSAVGEREPRGGAHAPATISVPVIPVVSDEARVREPVVKWLNELKGGGDGRSHWPTYPSVFADNPIYGNRLYLNSLRSYEILSSKVEPTTEPTFLKDGLKRLGIVVVRVEASDRNGHPTIKTYQVRVGDDGSSMFLLGA